MVCSTTEAVPAGSRRWTRRGIAAPSAACGLILVVACGLVLACGSSEPAGQSGAPDNANTDPYALPIGRDSLHVRVETVATGLEVPWDLDFAPDGRVFLTERTGRIRVVEHGRLRTEPWAEVDVYSTDPNFHPESGLMGIALAPDFDLSGHVYVMATTRRRSGSFPVRAAERVTNRIRRAVGRPALELHENRIIRFTERDGIGADPHLIVGGLPARHYHVGGALRFGPDGFLYFTTGDVLDPPRAQDPASKAGAILRLWPGDTLPANGSATEATVVAHGFRNSQGLAWHPDSPALFAIDHGPTYLPHEGGRYGHDEVNAVITGGNYGWPHEAGIVAEPRYLPPLVDWQSGAPASLEVYTGDAWDWRGNLLVGMLRGQQVRRVVVEPVDGGPRWRVVSEDTLFHRQFGRIRAVRAAPDGSLYLTTSNRDGRGQPSPGDDRLLRVTPVERSAGRCGQDTC